VLGGSGGLVAYMSMFWFFFHLSYYKFIDLRNMLPVTDKDIADSVILITILLSIGWLFSFFLNFKVTFPREESAFLKPRDMLLILFPLCILQVYNILEPQKALHHWASDRSG